MGNWAVDIKIIIKPGPASGNNVSRGQARPVPGRSAVGPIKQGSIMMSTEYSVPSWDGFMLEVNCTGRRLRGARLRMIPRDC